MKVGGFQIFVFPLFLILLSGCIQEGSIFKSSQEKETQTSANYLSASMEILPKIVYSGEKITVFVYLTNPLNRNLDNVLVCLYGYGIEEECKNTKVYEENEISFNFKAPELPENIEEEEYIYGKVFFTDSFNTIVNFPVIDEDVYRIKLRTGEKIPSLSLISSSSPLAISIDVDKSPIISSQGAADFEFTINIRNHGNGRVFTPERFSSLPSLNDDDMDKAYLQISFPKGLDISCERGKENGKYLIEFFDNEDSIYCSAHVTDSSLTQEKIFPVTLKIEYGYYINMKENYAVKGRMFTGTVKESEERKEDIVISFKNDCLKQQGGLTTSDKKEFYIIASEGCDISHSKSVKVNSVEILELSNYLGTYNGGKKKTINSVSVDIDGNRLTCDVDETEEKTICQNSVQLDKRIDTGKLVLSYSYDNTGIPITADFYPHFCVKLKVNLKLIMGDDSTQEKTEIITIAHRTSC